MYKLKFLPTAVRSCHATFLCSKRHFFPILLLLSDLVHKLAPVVYLPQLFATNEKWYFVCSPDIFLQTMHKTGKKGPKEALGRPILDCSFFLGVSHVVPQVRLASPDSPTSPPCVSVIFDWSLLCFSAESKPFLLMNDPVACYMEPSIFWNKVIWSDTLFNFSYGLALTTSTKRLVIAVSHCIAEKKYILQRVYTHRI